MTKTLTLMCPNLLDILFFLECSTQKTPCETKNPQSFPKLNHIITVPKLTQSVFCMSHSEAEVILVCLDETQGMSDKVTDDLG